MKIYEWCIAVLKGQKRNVRFSDMYRFCTNHYQDATFEDENALRAALEPYMDYFLFEDYHYDYVTFEDDGQTNAPMLELAKEVLRSHGNRYTLEVLCRRINDQGGGVDEAALKNMLSGRKCFTVESRSITLFKLSPLGQAYNIEPIKFNRGRVGKADQQQDAQKRALEVELHLDELSLAQLRKLKRAITAEEKRRKG